MLPVSLLFPRLPLLLVLSMMLVLSSSTAIKSVDTPTFIYFLVVPLTLVAPRLVHYILRLGYALSKDPAFNRSCSVRESLMIINHACTLAHMCFIPLQVGVVDLFLPLKLKPIVIHVVSIGVTIIQRWDCLLCVGVCRFGATSLAALTTIPLLLGCVGDLSPRLLLLIAVVVSNSASFALTFFNGNPAVLVDLYTVGVVG